MKRIYKLFMEIMEKIEIEAEKKVEVDAVVDTGAEISVLSEETLLAIGAKHTYNIDMITAGEPLARKPAYAVKSIRVRNCRIPILHVIGGRKNLLGRDILERSKAKIDE